MTPEQYSWVAPHGTRCRPKPWEGRSDPRPWAHRVSVCIPHLNTPEPLAMCVALLRAQTITPYIMIIDTGSTPDVCDRLEMMRSSECEIHYIRSHGYIHSSEPVCVALDLAHALCRTDYLYHTHSDVFVRRRDWMAWLLERCSAQCPVVGYQMTERRGTSDWRQCVSHTATMMHMPSMREVGASWSLQRWYDMHGRPTVRTTGWPDTESMMGVCLEEVGITPYFVGPTTCPGAKLERNFERQFDVNIDHCRSYPASQMYSPPYHARAREWMADALALAAERLREWNAELPGVL